MKIDNEIRKLEAANNYDCMDCKKYIRDIKYKNMLLYWYENKRKIKDRWAITEITYRGIKKYTVNKIKEKVVWGKGGSVAQINIDYDKIDEFHTMDEAIFRILILDANQ